MSRLWLVNALLFAALPATTNYQLNSYGFGAGGGSQSTANYALEGIAGDVTSSANATATYGANPGYIFIQQANVPKIATFDNNSGQYYNKLHFVIDEQGNPSDALYALTISTDNFASDNRFVKNDMTVGASLTTSDYKSYAGFGSASGANIIGLLPGTTYYLKAKATQGTYTESGYGPVSNVATANPSITFAVTTSAQASPPFSINFGTLTSGSVFDSPDTIDISLDTNAVSGANVYITGSNNGLFSSSKSQSITSASADLTIASSGFGGKNTSISQTSGGPFSVIAPYNGAGNNVGIIDTSTRSLYSSASPLTGGLASLLLKTKVTSDTVASTDYQNTITLVAAGSY